MLKLVNPLSLNNFRANQIFLHQMLGSFILLEVKCLQRSATE